MVENQLFTTKKVSPKEPSLSATDSTVSTKTNEYLSVSYTIDKISGIRSTKRSNSFRSNSILNIRTLISTILKKIKFSTRHKYTILYYDQAGSSIFYLEWRKLKDELDYTYGSSVKIRVCRHKINKPKPVLTLNESSIPNTSNIVMPNVQTLQNIQSLSPIYAATLFSYFNLFQMAKMQSMNNFMQ